MSKIINILQDNLFMIFYVTSLLFSLFNYKKYYHTPLKYFPILLFYIFLTEYLGFLIKIDPTKNPFYSELYANYNYVIYFIYHQFFFIYFYFLFWKCCVLKKNKKIIFYGIIGFIIITTTNAFYRNIATNRQLFADTYSSILLIISIVLYFSEKFRKIELRKSILFWISIGLVVYQIIYAPINIIYSYLTYETNYIYYQLKPIHLSATYFMHLCFMIGLTKKKL